MHFDTSSPESGWEPFVDEYEMPKRVVGDELARVAPRTLPITSLPPRRVAA